MEKKPDNLNPDIEFKSYKIISELLEEEREKKEVNEKLSEIDCYFPSIESFKKLYEVQIVKELITLDSDKFSSFFSGDNINLDKIGSIKSAEMAKFLLIFLGYINSKNDIYAIIDEDNIVVPSEDYFIDNINVKNYLVYLYLSIDYLKNINKLFNDINDIDIFLQILSDIGITIPKKEENALFIKMKKELFLSNEKNKILILLAPSNNFWIKSEKSSINDINYDKKLNNYSNIFYNKKFIKKFLEQVVSNPRCHFGLISSMTYRNLKACWETLGKIDNEIYQLYPNNVVYIDQNLHEQVQDPQNKDKKNSKKIFFRNMDKILGLLKNNKNKNKDNEQDDTSHFNVNNILILESEPDKESESTKHNSIRLNIFTEEYLQKNENDKAAIDLDVDKFIQYLVKLLFDCGDDIRSYIKQNPYMK